MRIGIDFTPAITQGAGIGRYTRNLVAALARLDTDDRFKLFAFERPIPGRDFPKAPNFHSRVFNISNRYMTVLWHRLRLPIPVELFTGPVDVFHGPDFVLPPVLRARSVVTIYDLAFLTNPECAIPSLAAYLSIVVPRAAHTADRIIAISQATANDLTERLAIPPEKIAIAYPGLDPRFTPDRDEAALEALRAKYGIERPSILAVSTIEPRKNYERLIAAFAQAMHEPDGPKMLVIAGRKGWLYDGVFETVEKLQLGERVKFLDYVSDAELPLLYKAADVLAMPSISEGFGIPVAEAMASGTPVVCSTGGSLPEIAGDAALTVDPYDVDGLAAALVRLTRDAALRDTLVTRGLERVKAFSWDLSARAHLDVYHSLGARH
ncbi:MAG: glycosyltransferase family 4 protein [Ktedonobacterales bacterium]